jgi:hypothetical protein
MNQHRRSFWKTILIAMTSAVAFVCAGHILAFVFSGDFLFLRIISLALGWFLAAVAALVVAAGFIVLKRDKDQDQGKPDLFLKMNHRRSESALKALHLDARRKIRRWNPLRPAWPFRVCDLVEIKSLQEIAETLDTSGSIAGLPFMPEMVRYCGQQFRAYRVIDKIYDYGRTKKLRRLDDSLSLLGLRCDGSVHGGCQAACYLIWKVDWLKPVAKPHSDHLENGRFRLANGTSAENRLVNSVSEELTANNPDIKRYKCQYTDLASASKPLDPWDVRQDLRPLWTGNVTLAAFIVALLTRLFNYAQDLRGGIAFPALTLTSRPDLPVVSLGLKSGESVRVLRKDEICRNLDAASRNRGLWFDKDMLKQAGQSFTVLGRVDQIIDDATGCMITMKTPCILLNDAVGSGEFLRFSAQHDYSFWREAWLARESASRSPVSTVDSQNCVY